MNARDDQGTVAVWFAVLGVSFLAAAGLAIDGGRKLGALSEARDLADNAARSCAHGVDDNSFRDTGVPNLDPTAATDRAASYLASTGHSGTVAINGQACTVTVTQDVATVFFPGPWEVSATETATAIAGVEGATP